MADTADRANEIEGQSTEREIDRIEAAVQGAEDMRTRTGRRENPGAEINTTDGGDQDPGPAAETGGPRGSAPA